MGPAKSFYWHKRNWISVGICEYDYLIKLKYCNNFCIKTFNDLIFIHLSLSRQYRLTKQGVLHLTDMIGDNLQFRNQWGNPLTPLQQVCLTMTFFASGTFQRTAGFISGDLFCLWSKNFLKGIMPWNANHFS